MEKWGIWGLGVVGKSVIRHLSASGYELSVYDSRTFSQEELNFLATHQVKIYPPSEKERFIQDQDRIVPSPGIDASSLLPSRHVLELDLFMKSWKKPLIAVTGSLGKTTLVTALDQIIKAHSLSVATGGNIGTPMLDLLAVQDISDYGLLELSSFQLEYSDSCIPDLAIWTTFHPNHLDRHKTLDDYFMAKYRFIEHQTPQQKALVPLNLSTKLRTVTNRSFSFFSPDPVTPSTRDLLQLGDVHYTLDQDTLIKTLIRFDGIAQSSKILIQQSNNPLHQETWLCALAACDLLGLTQDNLLVLPDLTTVEHRLEMVGSYKGMLLYNDSKSTIIESTIAAVHKLFLSNRPIHLLLGGLSKGVDRTQGIHLLAHHVKTVACFGKEAQQLHTLCTELGIDSSCHSTLLEALKVCVENAQPEDTILLSPGGSSYDLYKNFEERGNHFKALVQELQANSL